MGLEHERDDRIEKEMKAAGAFREEYCEVDEADLEWEIANLPRARDDWWARPPVGVFQYAPIDLKLDRPYEMPKGPPFGITTYPNPPARRAANSRPMVFVHETRMLLNAMSFALQRGMVMNTHLTINFASMGISAADGLRLLPLCNKAIANWLAVGTSRERVRQTPRSRMGGSAHHYVWGLENGWQRGPHIHQVMIVPATRHRTRQGMKSKLQLLTEMLRGWWAKKVGRSIPDEAIYARLHRAKSEEDAVFRHWAWFRYIAKNTGPDVACRNNEGDLVLARSFLKLPPYEASPPLAVNRLAGTSRSLSEAEQTKAGFCSLLDSGDWSKLYDGSELHEFRARTSGIRELIDAIAI